MTPASTPPPRRLRLLIGYSRRGRSPNGHGPRALLGWGGRVRRGLAGMRLRSPRAGDRGSQTGLTPQPGVSAFPRGLGRVWGPRRGGTARHGPLGAVHLAGSVSRAKPSFPPPRAAAWPQTAPHAGLAPRSCERNVFTHRSGATKGLNLERAQFLWAQDTGAPRQSHTGDPSSP